MSNIIFTYQVWETDKGIYFFATLPSSLPMLVWIKCTDDASVNLYCHTKIIQIKIIQIISYTPLVETRRSYI